MVRTTTGRFIVSPSTPNYLAEGAEGGTDFPEVPPHYENFGSLMLDAHGCCVKAWGQHGALTADATSTF